MSANKHIPHLLVIPEDDANRDIVTGFREHSSVNARQIQVENVACGWQKAVNQFIENHTGPMRKHDKRHVLIMIDFDERDNRFEYIRDKIPEDLKDRVYIMGSRITPEQLSANLGMKKEKIGEALANECAGRPGTVWQSDMLCHNKPELDRMRMAICGHLVES